MMLSKLSVGEKEKAIRLTLEKKIESISISKIIFTNNYIDSIIFTSKVIGECRVKRLTPKGARSLFEFYFAGLSIESRTKFHPYPLFHSPPGSIDEVSERIRTWENERNWIIMLIYNENIIIGINLLKRINTEKVTSGLAVRDSFQGKGLGYLLQILVVEQARLLDIEQFHIKVTRDNIPSIKLHEKCGFVKSGEMEYVHEVSGKSISENVLKMEIKLHYN